MENIPNIDPRKMALINEFKKMSANKNSSEMLPLLLAITRKSQSMGLSFTNEETKLIIDAMMSEASPAQKQQINMMLSLMNQQQNN